MATAAGGVAIVGGSVAGVRCVRALRQSGYSDRIVLFDRQTETPYDKPTLSKDFLTEDNTAPTQLATAADLHAWTVEYRSATTATGLHTAGPKLETSEGLESFDAVVVATGCTPRSLPSVVSSEHVGYLRSLDSARALRRSLRPGSHLVIIGGGFVGLEVASSARARGVTVTVIEAGDRVLARGVPDRIARHVASMHETRGVDVRTASTVRNVREEPDAVHIDLSDGGTLRADYLLVAVGADPVVDWLASASLELDNGVRCDDSMQTTAERVYAVGDCASFENPLFGRRMRLEHWTSACEQAAFVGRLLAGRARRPACDLIPYVWSDQYDLHIQSVGVEGVANMTFDVGAHGVLSLACDGNDLVGAAAVNGQAAILRIRAALRAGPVALRTIEDSVLQNRSLEIRNQHS